MTKLFVITIARSRWKKKKKKIGRAILLQCAAINLMIYEKISSRWARHFPFLFRTDLSVYYFIYWTGFFSDFANCCSGVMNMDICNEHHQLPYFDVFFYWPLHSKSHFMLCSRFTHTHSTALDDDDENSQRITYFCIDCTGHQMINYLLCNSSCVVSSSLVSGQCCCSYIFCACFAACKPLNLGFMLQNRG